MSAMDLYVDQAANRERCLEAILASRSPRKLIVAGPGTGKTYTFKKLLQSLPEGNKLALTFIRRLREDMEQKSGDIADVKTFHAYCKMLLHRRFGGVELVPYLTQVIEEDARAMRQRLAGFQDALQLLRGDSPEVGFYLARGDYYRAVSFDDSVFRVLVASKKGQLKLPEYVQIVVDEFQDFNPLEVAFIDLLQERGPILIAGDDDQAVYWQRNASPVHLRRKYLSGEYEVFPLPYCSRCPQVVVEGARAFISAAEARGGLGGRIPRSFVPFLEGKAKENAAYPRILSATVENITGLASLLRKAIGRIAADEVAEARNGNYPCVLVVGPSQYLNGIAECFRRWHSNYSLTRAEGGKMSLSDGYRLLLGDENSNLGWRVLAECDLPRRLMRRIVASTRDGTAMVNLLDDVFKRRHLGVVDILRGEAFGEEERVKIEVALGANAGGVIERFFPEETASEESKEETEEEPTVLLSSFEGCKGLDAGHVFVVGLNLGEMPRLDGEGRVADIEYCRFIVAMTRARKSLFLLSNRRARYGGPLRGGPRSCATSAGEKFISSSLREK